MPEKWVYLKVDSRDVEMVGREVDEMVAAVVD